MQLHTLPDDALDYLEDVEQMTLCKLAGHEIWRNETSLADGWNNVEFYRCRVCRRKLWFTKCIVCGYIFRAETRTPTPRTKHKITCKDGASKTVATYKWGPTYKADIYCHGVRAYTETKDYDSGKPLAQYRLF